MRKCDICQTPIPSGQVHCPKCGYTRPEDAKKMKVHTVSEEKPKQKQPIRVKNRHPKKHSFVFNITVIVCIAVISVFLIGQVNQYVMKTYSNEVESGTFYDFESLSEACPSLAKKISPYYKKVMDYQTEDSQVQELYIVDNFMIEMVEIKVDLLNEKQKKYFCVSNSGKDSWTFTSSIAFEKMDMLDFKEEHLEELTKFCGLKLTPIYEQSLNLYQQILTSVPMDGLHNDSSEFYNRGYHIEVNLEDGVKFTIENSQLGRMG